MKVGVIQSCYIPWRGYFDFIASVDLFVLYDDVQYSSGSWRNRNKLKLAGGTRWMTVPVRFAFGAHIDEVMIGQTTRGSWQEEHRAMLTASLGGAPYFADAMNLWESGTTGEILLLSSLNEKLIREICRYLDITTTIVRSSDYEISGAKTNRLISLLSKLGATTYVSGPAAKRYLDARQFREAGVRLEYKRYAYRPYPQQWKSFEDGVTVLDLVANVGTAARQYIECLEPNEIAVA